MQGRYGGYLIYGDPDNASEFWNRGFRQQAITMASYLTIFKMLSTFTARQWNQIQREGVNIGFDLTPEQRVFLQEDPWATRHLKKFPGKMQRLVLRISAPVPDTKGKRRVNQAEICLDGKSIGKWNLPSYLQAELLPEKSQPLLRAN